MQTPSNAPGGRLSGSFNAGLNFEDSHKGRGFVLVLVLVMFFCFVFFVCFVFFATIAFEPRACLEWGCFALARRHLGIKPFSVFRNQKVTQSQAGLSKFISVKNILVCMCV